MFKAADVVDEPFLQGRVPLVGDARPVRRHVRLALDRALLVGIAVTLQLQSPAPLRAVRLCEKTPAIKARAPLLARIARLPDAGLALDGISGVAMFLIFRANGGPIRAQKALGHILKRRKALSLRRRNAFLGAERKRD